FFHRCAHHHDLHSFPTRRSSDLETSALKLRLDPLQGALACLPAKDRAHVNPWRLTWRILSTDHPCHLRDLLNQVPPTEFLPLMRSEEHTSELQSPYDLVCRLLLE